MERLNQIRSHPRYQEAMAVIRECEQDRIFCNHSEEHFLDVARIAYILSLEQGLAIEKESIYAAAFLHDIGRAWQYTKGVPHEQASAVMAQEILSDCGFPADQTASITQAILSHRGSSMKEPSVLSSVLYKADKLSRNCYLCGASAECNWSAEKRNVRVMY